MADPMQEKNYVVASAVGDKGVAGHGGWSPLPDPVQEKNGVAVTVVVAIGVVGHGGSTSSSSPAVDAPRLPLLSDLGDPLEQYPAFEEAVSDEYSEVLP